MPFTNSLFQKLPQCFQRQVNAAAPSPESIPMDVLDRRDLDGDDEEKDTFTKRKPEVKQPAVLASSRVGVINANMARSVAAGLSGMANGLREPIQSELPRLAKDTVDTVTGQQSSNGNNSASRK